MAIGLLDLLGGYLGGLAVEETAKQTGVEDALRPRMQKVIQGAKDLGSDALDFFIPSANAAESSGNSGPAPGFRGPDLTQQQNTPIQGAPVESIVPSISVDGPPAIERIIAGQGDMVPGQQGRDGYYSPAYRPPVSDWTGEGRGLFDPARMSDREMSIEEEAMQTASDLLQMGGKSMADVGKKAAVEAATGEGPGFLSAIKNFIGDEEKMLTLAQAFNTMRTNRDDQLGSFIGKRLETLRGAKGANATIEYLIRQGRPELAEAVRGGTITAKEALDMVKGTSAMQEYKYAQQYQGYTGTLEDWMKLKQQQINLGDKGWGKVDSEFAQEYVDWRKGGQSSAYRNIGVLRSVAKQLASPSGEDLTGIFAGLAPDAALTIFKPEAKAARDRIASVVQLSMKEILGAQFTEKEGAQLIKRSYDPGLGPQENLARLTAMIMQLEAAAKAKDAMSKYFSENGTLKGMPAFTIPTAGDFEAAMDQAARRVTPFAAGQQPGQIRVISVE